MLLKICSAYLTNTQSILPVTTIIIEKNIDYIYDFIPVPYCRQNRH